MEDEASILLDGKAVGSLRVVDLKQELDKRGLSKSGSKKDLVKRLKQQLEFEKLCGERKSTGDCDLKLELDADTEQNEFVQQYLAQQQKIYAEQKEVKRLIELEEIQRSGDERGSDSPKADDASDQETHPEESSDNESRAETSEEKTQIKPEIHKYRRKKICKESKKETSKEKTETDSVIIVDKEMTRDNELSFDGHNDGAKIKFANIETTKILETKIKESKVEINEGQAITCENVKGDRKEECRVEEKEIGSVVIEEKNISKESRLEVIEKDDISSVNYVNKSNIKDCKAEVIEEKESSCVNIEKENKNEESGFKNIEDERIEESIVKNIKNESMEESKVETIKDESMEGSRLENIKDENMEESRVENIKDESMEGSRVENIKDESMESSRVENIKDESTEESRVENIKEEGVEGSRVENIKEEGEEGSRVENIKEEGVKGSKVENVKDESMERSRVETIKDEGMEGSRVENIKDESVEESKGEDVKDETVENSRIETVETKCMKEPRIETVIEKMETDTETIKGEVCRNQKSVLSCSLPLGDSDIKIQKLSERKSIKETSNTLKTHPSSLEFSETAELLGHNQALNMEPATEVSSVPYSLSDIQLPESPGSIAKPVSKSVSEEACTGQQIIEGKTTHPITTEAESHANGSNSSDESPVPEKQTSEPETTSTLNGESPRKEKAAPQLVNSSDSLENQVTDDSSKPLRDDSPSGVHEKAVSSAVLKDSREFSEGSEEGERKSDSESATEESSDSNERRRGRRKSPKVKRKKDRRRKTDPSDSSRSRSRESSSEKANKMDKESGLVSTKSDAQSASKSGDNVTEDTVSLHASVPTKQRLKLKRDNVVVSDSLHTTKKNSSASQVSDERNTSIRKNSDVVIEPATTETNKTKPVEVQQPVPKYVSTRKIRLSNRKLSEKSEDEPKGKKGKWGSFSSSQKTSQAISISTDSLKNWFPDFKLLKTPESVSEVDDTLLPIKEESHPVPQADRMDESSEFPLNVAVKDEPKVDEPEADRPDDGGVASNILFIQNLVRPFTLLQLKELLKETGNFIEEKFWIDKIKSKCIVMYETEEEAVKTRSVLNGSRWPSSNPKILSVEFATEENLQYHQSGSEPLKPTLAPPPVERAESRDDRTSHSAADFRKKEPERRRERAKLPVREWDKNKLTQDSPTRERASKSAERFKASDKREKKETKRRPNEDTPAKLLDDLFQKTKSSPCIYWLPLTEEQVVERKESQRLRRAEREKQKQQREQEDPEHKSKNIQPRNRTREMETRRSSTRSRSPVTRRR